MNMVGYRRSEFNISMQDAKFVDGSVWAGVMVFLLSYFVKLLFLMLGICFKVNIDPQEVFINPFQKI